MNKLCKKCNKDSEFSEFGHICKSCKISYDKEYNLKNINKKRSQSLEYSKSHKNEKQVYDKNYKLNNQDKVVKHRVIRKAAGKSYKEGRRSFIRRKYNMTLEDFDNMLILQDGKCKICGNSESKGKNKLLCIDHCHETGKVRGLLCHSCNTGIGNLRDNIDNLKNAIKYLEESLK